MLGNYPEDNILHPKHGESLKTTKETLIVQDAAAARHVCEKKEYLELFHLLHRQCLFYPCIIHPLL
jgi:hypothetical protein